MKETVQERTVLKEKVAEIFINGKNTMTVADIDELKRHTGSALHAMEVREDDEDFQNPVDLMMEELEKKNPNHFAVRQYKKYRLAAGKTAKSILVSCGAISRSEKRRSTRITQGKAADGRHLIL